ncbi:MAG: hypothetical protein QM753_11865 [Thermomicrobiales bacterium]
MSDNFAWARDLYPRKRQPEIGEQWAYRVKRTLGEPAQRVEVVQFGPPSSKNKMRIRFLDGDFAGLDEWVPKTRLILPWEEHDAWWQDELNLKAAWDFEEEIDFVEWRAVSKVFSVYGEGRVFRVGFNRKEYGLLEVRDEEEATKALNDLGLPIESLPMIFKDRHGVHRGPYSAAVIVAKHLCQQASSVIVEGVSKDQRRDELHAVRGWHYGKESRYYASPESMTELLKEQMPIYDLVRSWCSREVVEEFNRIDALEAEVARLRVIIEDQAELWERSGDKRRAKRLRNELNLPKDTSD